MRSSSVLFAAIFSLSSSRSKPRLPDRAAVGRCSQEHTAHAPLRVVIVIPKGVDHSATRRSGGTPARW